MNPVSLHKNENGFTLVELAIALTVIGLLIGGVLKGQELVENSRITATIKQLTDYKTAALVFRNTYTNLPGDIRNPDTRLPNCTGTSAGECAYPGVTTTIVGNGLLNSATKQINFWRHLGLAGLLAHVNDVAGVTEDTISPLNPFGGHTRVTNATLGKTAAFPGFADDVTLNRFYLYDPRISTTGIGTARAQALDLKMDDGLPFRGTIQLRNVNNCHTTNYLDYQITEKSRVCTLSYEADTLN